MWVVIFRAIAKQKDNEYSDMADTLRQLAINNYGCIEFSSVTEGDAEIAISYWKDEADIRRWKNAAEHFVAQTLGKKKWYMSYSVDIAEITRSYRSA